MGNLFDDIEDAFSGFGWESALEVAFITLVIFWLFRLIQGTTAMTVIRGISMVVVVIVVLSRALDSVVLDWLVNNALAVIVIFVLIVFQPEFRRALERVGRAGGVRSWLGAGRVPMVDVVRVITEAVDHLSTRKTGALIVIERETGLQDIVETGAALEATVTAALLESIFFPNSPLHDGAIVIRDDQLIAASCILPVSDFRAVGLDHLGTRHRAAIGMSNQTDAVVVVVSEETGGIAIATDGRLVRLPDVERLESMLLPLLQQGRGGNGRGGSRTMTIAGS
ncbi:MAG: diadenylate cyclase CdaA [Chloroflexi bacterium]|nr:diadenylate cyclase CdaA [Chloroflexota bacterium]